MEKQQLTSALNRLPDGTIELTITVPRQRIKETYQKALGHLAQNVTIKGFRRGKAPLKKAEEKIGKEAIHEEILKTLIPQVYLEAIKEQSIKPIIDPKVRIVTLEENKDWQIIATTCELPKANLKDYQRAVRQALVTEKIWVPGSTKTPKENKNTKDNRLEKIFNALLGTVEVKIPAILIEEEVNRMLTRLIDQTSQLGLTVEQYLTSKGKTNQQLRQEYQKQAEETLELELTLAAIAHEQKITVSDSEIEKMINAVPEEKIKKSLRSPSQKAYVVQLLRKRKVIDKLMKL